MASYERVGARIMSSQGCWYQLVNLTLQLDIPLRSSHMQMKRSPAGQPQKIIGVLGLGIGVVGGTTWGTSRLLERVEECIHKFNLSICWRRLS